jgi:hypothetical protein
LPFSIDFLLRTGFSKAVFKAALAPLPDLFLGGASRVGGSGVGKLVRGGGVSAVSTSVFVDTFIGLSIELSTGILVAISLGVISPEVSRVGSGITAKAAAGD